MTQKYHQGRALPHGVAQAYAVSIGRRDGQVLQYLPSERLVHEADGLDTFRGVANAGFVRSAITDCRPGARDGSRGQGRRKGPRRRADGHAGKKGQLCDFHGAGICQAISILGAAGGSGRTFAFVECSSLVGRVIFVQQPPTTTTTTSWSSHHKTKNASVAGGCNNY
jgi:hypothetical protein